MDDRLVRLEDKVDQLKDDVADLKTDFKVMSAKVSSKMDKFDEHIIGDNKIINHISPMLDKLPDLIDIVQEYRLEKKQKAERAESLKTWSLRATVVSSAIALIVFIQKITT
jgi:predicted  nucleic acid-binding Zn-ribbon protein